MVDHESRPDMTACIALFGAIDPHVNFIEVFAADIPDVAYVKSDADGKWSAEELSSMNWRCWRKSSNSRQRAAKLGVASAISAPWPITRDRSRISAGRS